ncbi:class I SAM-dependent methyltransferase [Microlunatus soli]|uniref:Methyltransferase domain-containing protein n=1 Tax=Microlunatus soli TaxID=630515 RepID=A0A1H1Y6W7_9ACTN|nr:class I SAM-dependent methyltransferase [Microlunatus soli]SDT17210.1 Methyltransferase domain-containing protein [Microlunatus soli]
MTRTTDGPRLIDDAPQGTERPFLPGMGKPWLMRFYDPLAVAVGMGRRYRRLVELAELTPGQRLLDVGCGTGTVLQTVARTVPGLDLAGLDPDRRALARAARKLRRAQANSTLIHGYADRLPFEDGSLDRIVSSLALHHLQAADRERFAAEALRVLRPGGTVTVLEIAGGATEHDHQRHQHHQPAWQSLVDVSLPQLFSDAGFNDAREIDHETSRLGPLIYLRADRR